MGSWLAVLAQIIWGLGPISPIQWIYREWVKKLSPNELDNGQYGYERWSSKNKQHVAEWIHNPRTQVFMSKEAFVHINCLNRIQVLFRLLQSSFFFILSPFSLGFLPLFILYPFLHFYPTRGQLMVYANTYPINPL